MGGGNGCKNGCMEEWREREESRVRQEWEVEVGGRLSVGSEVNG